MTRVKKWSSLKAWAMNVAKRRGLKKAIVALARGIAQYFSTSTATSESVNNGNFSRTRAGIHSS
jgi:hypothetical protein